MQYCALSFLRLGVAAFLAVWLITPAVAQQDPQSIEVGGVRITGLPDDWSHHHLIFSNPGTEQEALAKGTYERWLSVVNDPRYVIQQLKRRAPAQGPSAEDLTRIEELARAGKTGEDQNTPEPLSRDDDHLAGQPAGGLAEQPAGGSRDELLEWRHGPDHQHRGVYKDWSAGLDGAAATATGTVGSLSSSSISGSSTLTIGSVTFDASPPTAASATGTFTNGTAATGSVKITNGLNSLTITNTTASTASIAFPSGSRPTSGSTVTIGSGANAVTYTFESSLTSCSPNELYRGSSSSSNTTAIANLVAVLNGTGTAGSTTYCAGTTTP
ncbi:MAG: hypothetical protein WAM65_02215, partial [Candidatus Korobacteraceae bacterium]